MWFSIRSWRNVDLINIPLTPSGPYLSAMTYRSGIWIDVHDYIGSYDGGESGTEVSYDDGGLHSIPFQEEFEVSSLADFRFTSTSSIPFQLTFPLWILGLPVIVYFLFEATRQFDGIHTPSPNKTLDTKT